MIPSTQTLTAQRTTTMLDGTPTMPQRRIPKSYEFLRLRQRKMTEKAEDTMRYDRKYTATATNDAKELGNSCNPA